MPMTDREIIIWTLIAEVFQRTESKTNHLLGSKLKLKEKNRRLRMKLWL
jgi:hypothetical protein